ncbi:MAG TPA: DUF2147 domain-containing protein [Bacteroidales bacterium]|nr:DUF2147 domain-containing protein [Bacteroidales bacterium]
MTKSITRSLSIIMIIMFAFAPGNVAAQVAADEVTGIWLNEDKDAHVEIENRSGKYYGEIVWLKTPIDPETGKARLDDKNPDAVSQKRPLMGLLLLSEFVFDGDDEWKNGTVYDPKSGKTYSCYMEFTDKTKNKLKVRGYIGISLLGRTTYWTRVE